MDKNINVFGDSHTYGNGLSDCKLEKPWEQHSQLTWPYYIFNKKDINNFAYPGCSNDTISLKLIRHTSNKDVVLIMFTYPERLHIIKNGYSEISPPLIASENTMYGTGQLPKFENDQFEIKFDEGSDRKFLIPTAEVILTNIVKDKIVDQNDLPLRFVASTPCFRKEAGSYGKDTKGMIRQHQFYKVELVSIVEKENCLEELERMTNCATDILDKLELPYRKVILCSGDMGFSAEKILK